MVRRSIVLTCVACLWGCPDSLGGRVGGGGPTGLLGPTDLAGAPQGGSEIALTWVDHATVETGYRLEVNAGPFDTPAMLDVRFLPADAASFLYPAAPNSTYYFRVVAVTTTMESDPSNVVALTTPDVPPKPGGLTARAVGATFISLSWQDVAKETSYVIERLSPGTTEWIDVATVGADITAVTVGGLEADTEYGHRVIARNADGRSVPSDPAFALTLTGAMTYHTLQLDRDAGRFTSLVLAPDGTEHLSHHDVAATDLLYSTRARTGTPATSVVDMGPTSHENIGGDGTSIVLDPSGFGHIVAHDLTRQALRYASNTSGRWVTIPLEEGSVGAKPRLARTGLNGALHVVYQFTPAGAPPFLRHAVKDPGVPWVMTNLPVAIDPAAVHSVAIDPTGKPHVLAAPASGGLVHCVRSPVWTVETIPLPSGLSTVDYTSMTIDDAGTVTALFHETAGRGLYTATNVGGAWFVEAVDRPDGLDPGAYCALALTPGGSRLHAASFEPIQGGVRYSRKDPGGSWTLRLIAAGAAVGSHVALAVEPTGVVHIAYRNDADKSMRIAVGAP